MLNVLSNDVHIVRRLFWFGVFIFGVGYSMIMIVRNIQRYYEYPTMMRVAKDGQAVFPKITVCLNSMHSKEYLTKHYPDLESCLVIFPSFMYA